ncbi:hypothetical protein BCR42DRAFT_417132 [Absidia repens]|uniref:Arf-GAP domain-containing protein n=1 Tax=Absidia repens TaxID=90262 RepID=A0A1X2IEW1_9FUNG|nr:hypothetical protein BCR42DRAFT_417132 [Absidia repens]
MPERQTRTVQNRHERKLNEILKLPGNDRCADCSAKNPRWASYSLGVFLCIRCASLHRKMGTHVSKVKSLSMDTWSIEQIEHLRQTGGNHQVNGDINPCPEKHPLPLTAEDDEFQLEHYIRQKWEKRMFQEVQNEKIYFGESQILSLTTSPYIIYIFRTVNN